MYRLPVERDDDAAAWIRPYEERDLAAVYDICVRTADAGGDARGKYRSDDLMPDLFAGHTQPCPNQVPPETFNDRTKRSTRKAHA
jgi:hypothetical protein